MVLDAPLDIILVRKLGVPFQPELAMGAIGEGGVRFISEDLVRSIGVSAVQIAAVERRERAELQARSDRYRAEHPGVSLRDRVVIVVDDGVATGSTARAACQVARAADARRVILAVPVAPPDWVEHMGDVADEYVAVATPRHFGSVGTFYDDFSQTSDDEVAACLHSAGDADPDTSH